MDNLIKAFKDKLKTKSPFFDCCKYNCTYTCQRIYDESNVGEHEYKYLKLDKLLSLLHKKGYKFSQQEWSDIYRAILIGRTKSYLFTYDDKIIKLLFNNYMPTEKEVSLLINCYKTKKNIANVSAFVMYPIKYLLEQNYEFTDNHKKIMDEFGYRIMDIEGV